MNLLSQYFFLDLRYLFLSYFFHVLSGESYIIVLQNMNSVLFKMDSVPMALLVWCPQQLGFT